MEKRRGSPALNQDGTLKSSLPVYKLPQIEFPLYCLLDFKFAKSVD